MLGAITKYTIGNQAWQSYTTLRGTRFCHRFGDLKPGPTITTTTRRKPEDKAANGFYRFRLRYAPEDLLQAKGLIPREFVDLHQVYLIQPKLTCIRINDTCSKTQHKTGRGWPDRGSAHRMQRR